MLTVLSVKKKKSPRKIMCNSLKVRLGGDNDIRIRYLEYTCRNGRVNWRKIAKKAEDSRACIVCAEKAEPDKDSGVAFFEPLELRQRLCANMALEVLEIMKDVPKGLRVGLYDPRGEFSDLCEHLLRFTADFTVVTHNKDLYIRHSRVLLEEQGVVLCVCTKISALSRCGLIIAPTVISEAFSPMTKAVVLTLRRPAVSLGCRVYYRYSLSLPKEFEQFRPQDIPAEIFGGALYSLCSVYEVGSCVPYVCAGDTDTQTTLSLRKYFRECFGT